MQRWMKRAYELEQGSWRGNQGTRELAMRCDIASISARERQCICVLACAVWVVYAGAARLYHG